MKVSLEMLKKYNACEAGKKWFKVNYPKGIEVKKLLNDKEVPDEILHWGWKYLPVTQEEINLYNSRLGIVNSENCVESKNIIDCRDVVRSKNVLRSEYIKNSTNIDDCKYVSYSTDVNNGNHIGSSEKIDFSSYVISSQLISSSYNITNSFCIRNSQNIAQCNNLIDCNALWHSNDCETSGFGIFLNNCHNTLFCSAIENENYMIFNEHVSEEDFNAIYDDFIQLMRDERVLLIQPKMQDTNYYDWFLVNQLGYSGELSSNFVKWIKQVPNFNEEVMYNITYNPDWLKKEVNINAERKN